VSHAVVALLIAALMQQPAPVAIRVLDRGANSGVEDARREAVTSPAQFAGLWREHTSRPQPAIDFAKESVVALFLGMRNTGGYAVEIVELSRDDTGFVLRYRERKPSPDGVTAQVLTFPFVIAAVPRLTGPLRFELVP
jgi:hypothetical protein